MEVREKRKDLIGRVRILTVLATSSLVLIAGAYWFVQIAHGAYYRQLAENNRLRKLPIKALRGLVYDRKGNLLIENIPRYDLFLDRSRRGDARSSLAFAASILQRPVAELEEILERNHTGSAYRPVLLAEHLGLAQVSRFGVTALEHPEFEIEVGHLRLYRHSRQTAHVLGYLGEASRQDLELDGRPYRAGDLVGKNGIEEFYDLLLRGQDGERVVVVDSRGQFLEEYHRKPAVPGQNLILTLDLELQQEAERLLGDQVGAAVAMDPRNGEVLALVSSPSYNPNAFARRLDRKQWRRLLSAPHDPLQNRALQNTYSPGSVFKTVVAVAALTEGVATPEDRVWCRGSAVIYNHRFRCWKRGGHGSVNLREALKGSCDVYFYHLGQKLGIETIARYARLFGLGEKSGIDLWGEKAGLVPDPTWSLRVRRSPWYPGETISVAIGQGPLLLTPLQMSRMMAAIANGGHLVTPHLRRRLSPPPTRRLDIDPEILTTVRRALWSVVNERRGTGGRAAVAGLDVAGKTGTVQVVAQRTRIDNDKLPFEHRDHAWFASFAPAGSPTLVVVVFVEHGGMGSRAAAPIARALYEEYFRHRFGNRRSF